ncbi:MAG: hypothetical protein COW58_00070 [Thalassolituus sp. CG17_big_fil_post_rev_8_21_14_2_50_53_8]|nr:MAG: hypothetical protein COW58_00070 [Thalassolituus sp. CG17_big_fil_post_rev_8_21_14_2_50_53_8]
MPSAVMKCPFVFIVMTLARSGKTAGRALFTGDRAESKKTLPKSAAGSGIQGFRFFATAH